MEVRRKEISEYRFPFSELVKGNYFTFDASAENSPVFVFKKTGEFEYSSVGNEENYSIINDGLQVHRTLVKLANDNLFE